MAQQSKVAMMTKSSLFRLLWGDPLEVEDKKLTGINILSELLPSIGRLPEDAWYSFST